MHSGGWVLLIWVDNLRDTISNNHFVAAFFVGVYLCYANFFCRACSCAC